MTRVGQLWQGLTDEERDAVYYALRAALHDGGRFALALIADARGEPDHPANDAGTCWSCDRWAEHLTAWLIEEHGGQRVLWLCPACYSGALLHHEPAPGGDPDQMQALHRRVADMDQEGGTRGD